MSSSTTSGSAAGSVSVVEVTMPQMGVSVAEGTIVEWKVAVGDEIAAEATICEISTDKIDTEVPAPASGTVTEILVAVGETVEVGAVLARMDTGSGGGAGSAPTAADPAPPAARAAAAPGPPAAPAAAAPGPPAPAAASARAAAAGRSGPGRYYSPVVSRIAAEHGIDLDAVPGTGRDGRVRKQDVLALVNGNVNGSGSTEVADPPLHIESPYRPDPPADAPAAAGARGAPAAGAPAAGAPAAGAPAAGAGAVASDGGLSRMRRQIGEHMKRSLETAATCTTWIEVDMSRVERERARLKVTALAFVARAAIVALREYPALNAWLEGDRYTRVDAVNLGIAVSLGEDGLIVPVVHNAHELSEEGLAARIRELARRARSRELTADEVRGGTFTITNPGQYGSIMATPIINQPQVGILDLEAVVKRPVVVTDDAGNDAIAIRPMTILGLSWDHRALDGVLSAQFLAAVKRELLGA